MRTEVHRYALLLCLLLTAGCGTLLDCGQALSSHRSPVVRVSARPGFWCGAAVGAPVTLVLLPWTKDGQGHYDELAPMIGCAYAGATVTGGSAWLLAGWWWPHCN